MVFRLARPALVVTILIAGAACSKGPAPVTSSAASAAVTAEAPAPVAVVSGPCQALFDAMVAQARRPFAATMTQSLAGGPPTKAEVRVVGGMIYYQIHGAWRSSPQTTEKMVADLTRMRNTANQTCKTSGNESVNGQPALVIDDRLVNQGSVSDNRLWISKATGLPLKSEAHLQGGTVMTQTFSYDGVTAPAAVP